MFSNLQCGILALIVVNYKMQHTMHYICIFSTWSSLERHKKYCSKRSFHDSKWAAPKFQKRKAAIQDIREMSLRHHTFMRSWKIHAISHRAIAMGVYQCNDTITAANSPRQIMVSGDSFAGRPFADWPFTLLWIDPSPFGALTLHPFADWLFTILQQCATKVGQSPSHLIRF